MTKSATRVAGSVTGRTLASLGLGEVGRVSGVSLDGDDAALLRAMGLRRNAVVRMCRIGEPCIVALECRDGLGCRIGLSRRLASALTVEPA